MPGRQELPSTLERSARDAQRTWIKAHDSAVEQYGEGERAHRVAYGALKHTHEKVGDHWERKEGGRKGPSDPRSARPRQRGGRSGEGVDESASKEHLYGVARRLDIEGRSRMSKGELLDAIRKANRSRTRQSREG
ncbi:ChaB family protein [Streptomyces flavalbus]|uniref:ChaB family protein n=1 Tax=Streptomyces flavalbus TaxID=2665155 RepID=A0ABW2W0U3_9ACTN